MKNDSATTTTGRWKRRSEARPAEIVAAALALFVERGFATTRMEEIAARAGVTKGTVYLYFKSKEELFRAALEQSLVPTVELGEQLLESHTGSAHDLVRLLLTTWWSVIGREPTSGIPKLMVSEAGNFPALARDFVEKVHKRGRRLCAAALRKGVESGEFRADLNIDAAVRVGFAPVTAFVIH